MLSRVTIVAPGDLVLRIERLTGRQEVVQELHRNLADVAGVLRDQQVDDFAAQILHLRRPGIEPDHLDLALQALLAQRGGRALGRKQVGAEDAGQIRIGLQARRRDLGRDIGVVVGVLLAQILDVRELVLDRLAESLLLAGRSSKCPGMTLTTKTLPAPPICSARPRAASRPPSTLSVATSPSWMSESIVVSTHSTGTPASIAAWIGAIMPWLSFGAIMIASGALCTTAFRIGVCSVWSKRSGPWVSIVTLPSASALARAPQSIVM